ncbi:MAG: 2Fe-2S iron-sulfur cluster-binding protein [Cyanophyceae cyanobacterium]
MSDLIEPQSSDEHFGGEPSGGDPAIPTYWVSLHDRQRDQHHRIQVRADQYILQAAEAIGIQLPFACRNGACTSCAVRVTEGQIRQPEAMGISKDLKAQGYALLCVGYPDSDLVAETQDEDEVYELQFGRYFGKGRIRAGLPLDEE